MISKTVIVVPCYNEAKRLPVEEYTQFLRNQINVNIVFVNDGSKDETAAVLSQFVERNPGQVHLVDLATNVGKAEAVRQGIVYALKLGPDHVGFWDADLATPLAAIPQFVKVLQDRNDIDQVFGCRLKMLGRRINRKPHRKLLGKLFAKAASLLLGQPIIDTQCGAKLFRNTPLTNACFDQPFNAHWVFDVEIMARQINLLRDRRHFSDRVFEFPLEQWDEIAGSRLRLRDFVVAAKELFTIYLQYLGPFSRQMEMPAETGLRQDDLGLKPSIQSSRRAA